MRRWLWMFVMGCVACGDSDVIDTQPMPDQPGAGDPTIGDNEDEEAPPGQSPAIDPARIVHSGDEAATGSRLVVGLPGALSVSTGELQISNVTRPQAGALVKAPANDGSFTALLDAQPGETLNVELFEADANESASLDSVNFVLFAPSELAISQSEQLVQLGTGFDDDGASAPDSSGISVINVPPDTVQPGVQFVAANVTLGSASVGSGEDDGSLQISVSARSGDTVQLFAIEAGASNGGGPFRSYDIP